MDSKNFSDGRRFLSNFGGMIIRILLLFSILRVSIKTKRVHYSGQILSKDIFISSELTALPEKLSMFGYLPVMLFLENTTCLAIIDIATVWIYKSVARSRTQLFFFCSGEISQRILDQTRRVPIFILTEITNQFFAVIIKT